MTGDAASQQNAPAARPDPARGQGPVPRTDGAVVYVFLGLTVAVGLAAWAVGTFGRGYDYDEVLRAHSIWLTGRGLRPYSDFFEVHPPYFVLLSPIVRAFTDPVRALVALRLFAAAGNVFFLTGLAALGGLSLRAHESRVWARLAVLAVAFNPYIIDFLVEFRIDGWGYGLTAYEIVWLLGRPRTPRRLGIFGAVSALTAALFCPKLVFLAPIVVLVDLVAAFKSWRDLLRAGVAYSGGVAAAAAGFVVYLLANGISLERTALMLGRYHAVSNAHAGFRYGLLGQIGQMLPLLALVVGGASVSVVRLVRRETAFSPYHAALALWLLVQGVIVTYPYKQYYAPWFLFASGFVPPLLALLGGAFRGARGPVCAVACLWIAYGVFPVARFWNATRIASADNELIRWMNRVSAPEDRVVGSPPYHPIDRFDTFFLSFNTSDPKGFDSERIFATLPALRPFVTRERYRSELEAHPPALVVLSSPIFEVTHPRTELAVLEEFMRQRGYRHVRVGVVSFALRPDRYEHAVRNGYLP